MHRHRRTGEAPLITIILIFISEGGPAMVHRVGHAVAGSQIRARLSPGGGKMLTGAGGSWCTSTARTWVCVWSVVIAGALLYYIMALVAADPFNASRFVRLSAGDIIAAGRPKLQGQTNTYSSWSGDLRDLEIAWNKLCYGRAPELLRIALFVKKWPVGGMPGGLERHALTLYRELANRGHDVHVFTVRSRDMGDSSKEDDLVEESKNLHIHFLRPNAGGNYDYGRAWNRFAEMNRSSDRPFDIVHSESVALPHWRARNVSNVAASWHGIAFESIHGDIVQEVLLGRGGDLHAAHNGDTGRKLQQQESGPGSAVATQAFLPLPTYESVMLGRLSKVLGEIRFFHSYRHHVATSDSVGDVLRNIYQIPTRSVHVILNGVDAKQFHPDTRRGAAFRAKYRIPSNASVVLGVAGRLVQDKGHPLLATAFAQIAKKHPDVFLLVAGSGPWGSRYEELAPKNVKNVGPLRPDELRDFYNAIDIFVNPTFRSQGMDHTQLEAMQCGKPLLATHFSSITWSVIVDKSLGSTFFPNVPSLVAALEAVVRDGRYKLRVKGEACRKYAADVFTATKMGSAYERLFLCMKNEIYCRYPLPSDRCTVTTPRFLQS